MKEDLLVAWALQNQDEFFTISDRFHEGSCRSEPWVRLWPLLWKGYQQHERFPAISEVDQLINKLDLDATTKVVACDILRQAYTAPVSTYTQDDIQRYLVLQEFHKLGMDMVGAFDKSASLQSQVDFYTSKLERISAMLGTRQMGTRYSPFDNPRQWYEKLREGYGANPLPTPFYRLNKKLRGGGILPTLTLLVGPTGGGKSTLLKAIEMHACRQGKRWVNYTLDDSEGDMLERQYAHILRRPILPADILDEQRREEIGRILEERMEKEYPGCYEGYSIEPNRYTFKDVVRHLTQLQAHYRREDLIARKHGYEIADEDLGRIDGVGIDTGDQMRTEQNYKSDWLVLEKLYESAVGVSKRFHCPVVCTVQGNQETVGASQITVRNLGGSYGKAKPAKLILGVAQTVQQSQSAHTIDPAADYITSNLHHLHGYDPLMDRNTEWEPAYICVIKNTMASSEAGRGMVKNVMVPVLIDFSTCRMLEDFSKPEELMRASNKTLAEEREAQGVTSRASKKGAKG